MHIADKLLNNKVAFYQNGMRNWWFEKEERKRKEEKIKVQKEERERENIPTSSLIERKRNHCAVSRSKLSIQLWSVL